MDEENTAVETQTLPYSDSLIHYKYNTEQLIEQFKITLKGQVLNYERNDSGNIIAKAVQMGEQLCNSKGFQTLVNRISSIINSQNVHGNLETKDDFLFYLSRLRQNITDEIFINRINWGIEVKHLGYIIDSFMDCVYLFLSRTIGDGERKNQLSTKYVETNRVESGGRSIFSFRK